MVATYLEVLRKYAFFSGRARRREYWSFALVNLLIIIAFEIPIVILNAVAGQGNILSGLISLVVGLYGLAILIPGIAVSVRRLHDTGRSGWWILIAFVPFVGAIVLLVFHLLDSVPGTNRWGPSPKFQMAGVDPTYVMDAERLR